MASHMLRIRHRVRGRVALVIAVLACATLAGPAFFWEGLIAGPCGAMKDAFIAQDEMRAKHAASKEYLYDYMKWIQDFDQSDEELEAVVSSMPWEKFLTKSALWREDFRKEMLSNSANSGTLVDGEGLLAVTGSMTQPKDHVLESVFNAMNAGTFLVEQAKIEKAYKSWLPDGPDAAVDVAAVKRDLGMARFMVSFSWFFLNIFAPFCVFFFVIRPCFSDLTGWLSWCTGNGETFRIDMMPGVDHWWRRTASAIPARQYSFLELGQLWAYGTSNPALLSAIGASAGDVNV